MCETHLPRIIVITHPCAEVWERGWVEKQKDAAREKKEWKWKWETIADSEEVEQELNLQDQAECLSGADSDWKKDVLWLYLHLKGL